jgi:TPR repeat protein
MYRLGQGVEQDDRKAFILAQKSALQGYGLAQLNLGYAYRFGEGTTKNLVKAMQWYLLSKAEGQTAAEFNLRKIVPALSSEQRAEARFLADQCLTSNFSDCG